jgi:predicted AlkP superfamily phosphohydrolase/phosphomutase/tetratricopeptide (TPR) repeat protein
MNRRVLLVGWDAADWKVIHPLLDSGHMPNLARLVERGVMGNLATLSPILSPMLWTSIATGKRAYKHGVHGFTEVAPETGHVRPVSTLSRTTKAVWNILHQEGKTCHVVGWWPSHPVEPLRGAVVSNHFQLVSGTLDAAWPLAPGTVHPPEMAETLAKLRIHPHELEGDMLRSFVPRAPEVDQETDKRLHTLARVVAECASVHAAATHILATRPDWDFAAVYYDAIDHFSHAFMRYHPPRLEWVNERDFELYSRVVQAAYVFHDSMLGALVALAGEEATVLLVSDHGFHSDGLRPRSLPNEPAGPAAEHRPLGIFVAAGPGIRTDAILPNASILDVAPTVLSLFDLPSGRDMDGQPLTGIYEHPREPRFIDSWDDVPGDAALLDRNAEVGSESAAAVVRQLADLGYIDPLPENLSAAIDQTIREQRWNLARALVDGGRQEEAAAMLADLWDRWPDEGRFGVALLNARLDIGQLPEARETFELLAERKRATMLGAVEQLEKLAAKIRADQGLPPADPEKPFEGVDFGRVPEADTHEWRKLRGRANANPRTFAFLEGSLLAAERRPTEALAAFDRAAGVEMSLEPSLRLARGEVLLAMRRPAAAEREYRAVIEIDPLNAAAHFGRGRAAFARGDDATAAAAARAAIGCRPHFPRAHLLAGRALWRSGQVREAGDFLAAAVRQEPLFPAGHRLLGAYLGSVRGDLAGAIEQRWLATESRKLLRERRAGAGPLDRHPVEMRRSLGQPEALPPRPNFRAVAGDCVIVVTGLPRSGTSMMMQMLAAGGVLVLADDERLADESNPRGYLEFEPVKRIVSDRSWLREAVGKGVKIVSPLVTHLPRDAAAPPYLVIAMRRPIAEIVASQRAMLARSGRPGAKIPDAALASILEGQGINGRTFLAHLEATGKAKVLDVAYHAAVADPAGTAWRVIDFLGCLPGGGAFDVAAAAAAVDAGLHRVRETANTP